MLVGIVASGVLTAGIAAAAGWSGPPSPAPFNNTPELIWNSQESGFVPQNASFSITGSGVLAGTLTAAQIAAGGYGPDPSGIAFTAPSMWATDFGAGNATVYGNLVVDPAAGSITLGGETRSTWPVSSGGDITSVSAGPNLSGGGATGDVTLKLVDSPSVTNLTATGNLTASGKVTSPQYCIGASCIAAWPAAGGGGTVTSVGSGTGLTGGPITGVGSLALDTAYTDGRYVNATGDTMTGTLTAPQYCIGASCISSWPVPGGGGDITGVKAGQNLLGGGTSGEVTLDLNSDPSVTTVTASGAVHASQYCIGASCISSWPAAGGGGTVTSVGSGTGLTGGPITGVGSLALDTAYTDSRYVDVAGDTMTGALTVTNASGVTSPRYCIGASCIAAWPVSSGGTVTSITQGTGITATPNPITGAGTIAFDQTYGDNRYVNNVGPDQVVGEFGVTANTAFSGLHVVNGGSGIGVQVNSSGSNATVQAQNSTTGPAGYFQNSSGIYTYLAWGGTYGVYTTGNVSAASVTIGGVSKSVWPALSVTTVSGSTALAGWNNAPSSCPAGSVVTGIACFIWDFPAVGQYVGCVSKAAVSASTVQIYGQAGKTVSYSLYCASVN